MVERHRHAHAVALGVGKPHRGVIAVVEEQRVQRPRDEVPGVVPLAVGVSFDVLQVIHHLDGEERDLLRNEEEEQSLAPVGDEERRHAPEEDRVLGCGGVERRAIALPQVLEEGVDVLRLRQVRQRRIHQQGSQVVPLEPLGRARAVPGLVVQLVVDLVVRRHPGDGRMAVEDRDPVAGQ